MTGQRLVIVTYNWPPRNAIGTHRPYAWAKVWASLGRPVTVLTAQKHSFDEPLDLELAHLSGVNIVEVPWEAGAVGRVGSSFLRSKRFRRFARLVRAHLNRYSKMPVEPRQGWLAAARPVATELAEHADLVISTFGPAMSHQLGALMKQLNPKLFWLADYRDLWSQAHLVNLTAIQKHRIERLELATVGTYADAISTVSEDMVRQLTDLTGRPVILAPNGFDLDEEAIITRLSVPRKPRKGPLRVVHTGMLYEGKRNPEPLLIALAQLAQDGRIKLGDVIVDFYGSRIDVARALAEKPEFHGFVNPVGHVPRAQALEAQQNADLLLLLESSDPSARGVLTGKVFEYLAAGTPIISLGSLKDYEIPRLLALTGTGMAFESHEIDDIKTLILAMLSSNEVPDFFRPDIAGILNYSRIGQTKRLFEAIDR